MSEHRRLLFDAELAWKVYDHIVAHPEEWDQEEWVKQYTPSSSFDCGTKACYAGTLALMIAPIGTVFEDICMTLPDNDEETYYDSFAKDVLTKGTTSYGDIQYNSETWNLRCRIGSMFYGNNKLCDLKRYIEALAEDYPSI